MLEDAFPARSRLTGFVLLVLVLALVVRLVDIAEEPYWLDEIISHDFTSGSVMELLEATAHDVHPPGYYLGLKAWRTVFGSSIAAERSLSAAWSVFGVGFVILLGRDLVGRWSAGLTAGLLMAVNGFDVFHAQETRMYAQAAALCALSSWLLLRWMTACREHKKSIWRWAIAYWLAATLLSATHYVGALVLASQGIFALAFMASRRAWRTALQYLGCAAGSVICMVPWFVFVVRTRGGLYGEGTIGWRPSLAPISIADPVAVLTRHLLWGRAALSHPMLAFASIASVAVLLAAVVALVVASKRRGALVNFGPWLVFGPLVLAVSVSWLILPVLDRRRFAVFLLAAAMATIGAAISLVRRPRIQVAATAMLLTATAAATVSQQRAPQLVGLGGFAALWEAKGAPDHVLLYPRWNRRVAGYYLGQPVLNVPTRSRLERELRGDQPSTIWVCRRLWYDMKHEPADEQALHDWVLTLGSRRHLGKVDDVEVVEVLAQPLIPEYPPLGRGVEVEFGDTGAEPYLWSGWYAGEEAFRWSQGKRAVFVFGLTETTAATLSLDMFCFSDQRIAIELNGARIATFSCSQRASHVRRFDIPDGILASENTLTFLLPDAVSPAEVTDSRDTRKIALGINSLAVE